MLKTTPSMMNARNRDRRVAFSKGTSIEDMSATTLCGGA
jgi:hypothetical protein